MAWLFFSSANKKRRPQAHGVAAMGVGSETCAAPGHATRGDFLLFFCCVLLVLLFLLVFRDLGVLRLSLLLSRKQEEEAT